MKIDLIQSHGHDGIEASTYPNWSRLFKDEDQVN